MKKTNDKDVKQTNSKKKKYIIIGIVAAVVILVIALISIRAARMNKIKQFFNNETSAITEQDIEIETSNDDILELIHKTAEL